MARYTESVCRLCRRQGVKLFLKGDKCFGPKCPVERRNYAPGEHGQRRRKISDYGIQLKEKQKIKDIYGVLERQFRKTFEQAERRPGITGENLLQILE
ncbi:MAG: 30S ribosomal protein S4, partial [Chloroflexota bacterium]